MRIKQMVFATLRRFNRLLPLILALSWITPIQAAEPLPPPRGVQMDRDIVYGKGGEDKLRLDLARPVSALRTLPCVLVLHGGGWFAGDKSSEQPFAYRLARNGYAAALVNYRLAPKDPFPAAVEDVKCAVRFLRAHAEKYGLAPDRIGATGISAGAHLAMMLGVTGDVIELEGKGGWEEESSRISVVVSFYGPVDLTAQDFPEDVQRMARDFISEATGELNEERRRAASPVTYVDSNDAPILMLHGTTDELVPYNQVITMLDAMTKANLKGGAGIIAGAGHGWGGAILDWGENEALGFLERYLKPSKIDKKK